MPNQSAPHHKKYPWLLLPALLLIFFHGFALSHPQQLTGDQLIRRVQQQTGAKVVSLTQAGGKNNFAQVRLLYPNGEVKQLQIDVRSGKPAARKINTRGG